MGERREEKEVGGESAVQPGGGVRAAVGALVGAGRQVIAAPHDLASLPPSYFGLT